MNLTDLRIMLDAAKENGILHTISIRILVYLSEHKTTSISELVEYLGISPQSLSQTSSRMIRDRYITRDPIAITPGDRNITYSISNRGARLLKLILDRAKELKAEHNEKTKPLTTTKP